MSAVRGWDEHAESFAQECLSMKSAVSWKILSAYCLKMDFMERLTVHFNQIVCSPNNRNGYGCNGHDTHENIDIITSAWCDEYFDGIITEIDPSKREEVLKFNETMVAASQGRLAPVDRQVAKFQTYAGSHTTQGLRNQYFAAIDI